MKTWKLYGISISLILINLATMMRQADEKLLSAVTKEVKETFNVSLSDIGYLIFIRNLVQGIASPLAGFLVISYDRPTVFAIGSFCWVLSTAATGASYYFSQVSFGVAINGLGHAIVYPVLQSFIADSFKESSRGVGFGLWGLIGMVGAVGGSVVATIMAGREYSGMAGWRCAYILVAMLSAVFGFLVFFFVTDPKKKKKRSTDQNVIVQGNESEELMSDKGSSSNYCATTMESSSSSSVWKESLVAMKDVTKIKTFQIIVLQGIVGSIPWHALNFYPMWFELIGFDHTQTAILAGIFTTGNAIGYLVGGIIADKMLQKFPNSGRIFCAQFSILMGILFSILILKTIPQSIESYYIFLVTLFLMGVTIPWCGPAVNYPMLAEVVPLKHRTMIYAFDRGLEGSFSSFSAPLVGILSEKMFGFDSSNGIDHIVGSGRAAEALSKGILWTSAVSFGLCCLCYVPLHFVNKKDREIAKVSSLKEVEMI